MTLYCRRCQQDRPVEQDVMGNQRVVLCAVCGHRVADGPALPSRDRINTDIGLNCSPEPRARQYRAKVIDADACRRIA